jgi:menaquinone-dependent protoporphyrinogen IX oxidase
VRALVLYDRAAGDAGALARTIAGGLPSGFQARALCLDDATGADLDDARLVVIGGAVRRLGPSPRMRAFFARTDRAAWRDRHVAVYATTADRRAGADAMATRMTVAWLRRYHVARPIPRTSFLLAAPDGPLDDAEPVRAASWALSLPIAAHLHQTVGG